MWKFGFVLIAAYVLGGFYFTWSAVSRAIFDDDVEPETDALTSNRQESFVLRLIGAWLWPIFIASPSGRKVLGLIWK